MKELLLVEDDTIFANTLMRRLTKHGFNCVHVDTNSEALLACHLYFTRHEISSRNYFGYNYTTEKT